MSDSWTGRAVGGQRVGAVEYVLRDVTDAIEAGIVKVGERLPSETALAARYSVSRTVIREVLRACEARGLTVTRNGKGTFVLGPRSSHSLLFGDYSAAHLLEARPHIEVPAAGLAALRRTEAEVEALHEIVEAMEVETDPAVWVAMDGSFHLALADASRNPVFVSVLRSIREALSDQSALLNRGPGRRQESDVEHRSIVSAIARGSSVEAEDAMQYHLDQVKDAVSAASTAPPGATPASTTPPSTTAPSTTAPPTTQHPR
ncbi:FCD domain-containing protein [Microbacteriaceae bacterium VKM Ac-2855]|nr:FCD domain-containing protein [Microbacteriaceae bacterium VKM Ac-2855]